MGGVSRYHTEKELDALAILVEAAGYPIAGSLIRRNIRNIAVMDPQTIRDDPDTAGEHLAHLVEAGDELVYFGPRAGSA